MADDHPVSLDRWQRFEPFILFLAFYLPGYLFQTQHLSGRSFNSVAFNLSYLLQAAPRIILLFYLIALRTHNGGPSLRDFGLLRLRLAALPPAIICFVVIEGLILGVASLLGGSAVDWRLDGPGLLPLVFLTTMAAGYSEEIFFRSYLLTVLPSYGVRVVASVIVSTILFAAGHLYEGAAAVVGTLVIGVVLSVAFLRWRNLHIIAIAHGLYNFATLVATLLPHSAGS